MAPVEIILSTILCAVPAFMREDPARTSAPTSVTMAKSPARSSGELRLHVSAIVRAPRRWAYSTAAMVKGVRPLLAMPRTISRLPGFRFLISSRAREVSSSLASVEAASALGPPAMMYCTLRGLVLKVGGISEASRAPMRPLVPAPDRKSTRLNSSHLGISYAVFCLKKKKRIHQISQHTVYNRHGPFSFLTQLVN